MRKKIKFKKVRGLANRSGNPVALMDIGIIAGGRVIARADMLLESPDEIWNYTGKNPYSQNTVFHLDLDTTQLPNGINNPEFWTGSGSKIGIFFKKRVIIAN